MGERKQTLVIKDKRVGGGEFTQTISQGRHMYRVGIDSFFWPIHENMFWYLFDGVLRVITQPTSVTARHVRIDKEIYPSYIPLCTEMHLFIGTA